MTYLFSILGSGIISLMLVLITQLFTYNGPDIFPIIFIYWGIMVAALGLGHDPERSKKVLFIIFCLQGIILLSIGLIKFFKADYNSFFLYRAIAGLAVLVIMGLGYQFGKKNK